ncbi:mitochondrial thiamine pyrophosphate transporter [Coelomomyces lativittatus]|nr:mitochondrial thiamine pyrophosphate transporter [Coelomomyces lativittatus]
MVATCVSYPFDLLRTHYSIHPSGPTRPISIVRKIMDTYSTYGFRGYYKGLFPALFQVTPYMGCTFGMYESLSGRFPNHPWVCGAVAGMCAKTLVFPFDTLRRRLQVTVLRSPSLLPLHQDPLLQHSTVRRWVWNMVRSEGLVSLYRGLLPGLLKAAPSSGVTFGVFHGCVSLSESWKSMDSSQP